MTTFRTSSDPYTLAAIEARSPAVVDRAQKGFGQGRSRLRALWRRVWPSAAALAIFALLMIAAIAIRILVWAPLHNIRI